jgi:hypothetical protein
MSWWGGMWGVGCGMWDVGGIVRMVWRGSVTGWVRPLAVLVAALLLLS